jgi:serine/threonine protein kinase
MVEQWDREEYVVKVRMKRSFKDEDEKSQWCAAMTQFLAGSLCPYVLEILEVLEDRKAFYVVMPKCSGGELYDFLIDEKNVPVQECKRIIREILVSLDELHSKGLIHRDVKPENIMFDKSRKTVKLIDFDTCRSRHLDAPKPQRIQGTPGYIAPEVLVDGPSPKSDLFAVGVILYLMMTSEMPWAQDITDSTVDSANAKAVYESLRDECIDWNEPPWLNFPCAADLCQQLMAFDPIDRPSSASAALNHPWFRTKLQ